MRSGEGEQDVGPELVAIRPSTARRITVFLLVLLVATVVVTGLIVFALGGRP